MTLPINPDKAAFVAYAAQCTAAKADVIPLVCKLPNEGLFVWSAFAALERDSPYAFLLESAETGKNGRYSFMGAAPRRCIAFQNGELKITERRPAAGGKTAAAVYQPLRAARCDDPLRGLEDYLAGYRQRAPDNPLLPPFLGGAVGYLGYDCAHYFEPIGNMKEDLLQVPDMLWMQTDCVAAFDHYRQELILIKNCYREEVENGRAGRDHWGEYYPQAMDDLRALLARLQSAPPPPLHLPSAAASAAAASAEAQEESPLPQSNFSRDGFCGMVERAKTHIRAGDIFQVVPSQRFTFPQRASAVSIYRRLRRINPSPYMFHLKCGNFSAVGSSPELMLGCSQGELTVRPIAGSRPRGKSGAADAALEAELRADAKETAEHLMLVDLGRNDLGRVAAVGSVCVPPHKFCRVERYSHIMHIVSDVQARLAGGKTPFDAMRATFPAGTLSGAPKVRAMQIINNLEPCKRNLYGGLAGYLSHTGDILTCIVIRTLVAKDGYCHVQAGGGIVADSQPQKEYEESVNKAMAALKAAAAERA